VQDVGETVGEAYGRERTWLSGIRAGLGTMLALFERDPATAWLCLAEPWGAGERILGRCAEISAVLAAAVELGRGQDAGHDPPPVTGEALVGGVLAVIHTRLQRRGRAELMDLLGPLMSMIALPYLGPVAARQELSTPAGAA
jgi:hypothetical protein